MSEAGNDIASKIEEPMKTIVVVCPYPLGRAPSQHLKWEQYLDYLEGNGYRIQVEPFFTEEGFRILYQNGHRIQKALSVLRGYLRRLLLVPKLLNADGIFVHLYVTPLGSSGFERLYRFFSRKVVYDIDDLVHTLRTSQVNRLVAKLKSAQKYYYQMQSADHVITCTPYLDEIVRRYNRNTTDISSTINTETYEPVNGYRNDHPVVIGWSGSVSTGPYLYEIGDVLTSLAHRYEFKLLVIGARDFALEGVDVEVVPWSKETEVRDLQRIDIGVYPLPDEEWVLGKSGLKALQYQALGIPVVATAVGANFRVVQQDVTGFLVKTHDEWYRALETLLNDARLRQRLGQAAREHVEETFSVRANRDTYLSVFRHVYGAVDPADWPCALEPPLKP